MRRNYISDIPDLNIIQICMDLVSAIWDKKREDYLFLFSVLSDIGKFAHFLQSLRRDHDKIISLELLRQLALTHRITETELYSLLKEHDGVVIGIIKDGNFHIEITTFEDVVNFCSSMWKKLYLDGMVRKDEICLLELLIRSLTPIQPQTLSKLMKKYTNLKEIINISKQLGLLIEREQYFFSPCFLKESKDKTLDLVSEFNIGTADVLSAVEKVTNYPGIPLKNLSPTIQGILREGGLVGLLLPATVHLGSSSKEFIFADPENFKDADLAYQVAAYIRYNEHFAKTEKGRLRTPIIYLNRLISNGIAGNATNIGWNYRPLEIKGIIKVVPGQTSGRFSMMLLKDDPVKKARNLLQEQMSSLSYWDRVTEPPEWLSDPATFRATHVLEYQKKNQIKLFKLLRDRG